MLLIIINFNNNNFVAKVEASSALTPDHSRSRPADSLVNNWMGGIPAAFDITVTTLLAPVSLREASVIAGTAARLAEQRKHQANDPRCHTLGWNCIPLAVESYENWGLDVRQSCIIIACTATKIVTSFFNGHHMQQFLCFVGSEVY